MNDFSCDRVSDLACELALDVLAGDERAAALAHLETCASCRHEVAQLTETAEDLLLLAPEVEPSSQFESDVLARVDALAQAATTDDIKRTRARRLRRVMAAVTVAAALVVVGVVVVVGRDRGRDAQAATVTMRAAAGQAVGTASLSTDPPAVRLAIPDWLGLVQSYGGRIDAKYWLAIESKSGARELERLPAADLQPWNIQIDRAPSSVTNVAIVDD